MDSAAGTGPAQESPARPEPPAVLAGAAQPGNGRGWLRLGGSVVAVLALAFVTVVVWPPARALVQQSFTQMPETFTELYFVGTPGSRDGTVTADVALVHHGPGTVDYTVEASLATASANGLARVRRHVTLRPARPEIVTFALTIPAGTAVDALAVNSPDSPDSLRFHLPAAAPPTGPTP